VGESCREFLGGSMAKRENGLRNRNWSLVMG
jgi:hypothetical protein